MIKIKRVYDSIEKDEVLRILIDRIWPRGVKKDKIDIWLKDIAPSDQLRKWFNHDPNKWDEFKKKYFEELNKNPELNKLIEIIKNNKNVTLLYSAKSPYNSAVALKEYLESFNII